MKKLTSLFAVLFCVAMFVNADIVGTINKAIPEGWSYITNNENYPNPAFYSDGGLKINFENMGIASPVFEETASVEVVLTINSLNQNTKTAASEDVFTITGLNAGGSIVATATMKSVVKGDNTATLSGEGITQVKVIMTGYPSDGTKYCNVSLGAVKLIMDGGGDDPIVDPVEGDYSFEPTTVTTITETMDYAEYVIVADYNMIEVYMESETSIIDLWLFADNLANGIPAGTYTINSTMEPNTAMASPGGDDEYDYPSYLATDFTAEGYTSAYYLTAGTVTVTKEDANTKIVVAATSYYGSTINATYEGEIEEYIEDAVENVMTNALKVRLDNGNLIVPAQVGDKVAVFNATGQILYDATAAGETTICGLQAGQVVIVRVADKATKVVL